MLGREDTGNPSEKISNDAKGKSAHSTLEYRSLQEGEYRNRSEDEKWEKICTIHC
jgi:hypothetical protein